MVSNAERKKQFDWYEIVSGDAALEQGDLLDNFPIFVPSISLADVPTEPGLTIDVPGVIQRFNIVIMTQSCDFLKLTSEDEVILSPRYNYLEFAENYKPVRGPGGWKNLVNGRILGAYLINRCDIELYETDYQIVDIRRIFTVPLAVVQRVATNQGTRIRLLPPYREHLAQAFARQFMRVGLPIDLPRRYPFQK